MNPSHSPSRSSHTHPYKRSFAQLFPDRDTPNYTAETHLRKVCKQSQSEQGTQSTSSKEYRLAKDFRCPFSQTKLRDPVMLSDGYSYQKQYVQRLLNPTRINFYRTKIDIAAQQNPNPQNTKNSPPSIIPSQSIIPSPVNPTHCLNPQIQIENITLKLALDYIENFMERERVEFITFKKQAEMNIYILNQELGRLSDQLSNLSSELDQKNTQLHTKDNDLMERNKLIDELKNMIEQQKKQLETLKVANLSSSRIENPTGQEQRYPFQANQPTSSRVQQKIQKSQKPAQIFYQNHQLKNISITFQKPSNYQSKPNPLNQQQQPNPSNQQQPNSQRPLVPISKHKSWRVFKQSAPMIDLIEPEDQSISQNSSDQQSSDSDEQDYVPTENQIQAKDEQISEHQSGFHFQSCNFQMPDRQSVPFQGKNTQKQLQKTKISFLAKKTSKSQRSKGKKHTTVICEVCGKPKRKDHLKKHMEVHAKRNQTYQTYNPNHYKQQAYNPNNNKPLTFYPNENKQQAYNLGQYKQLTFYPGLNKQQTSNTHDNSKQQTLNMNTKFEKFLSISQVLAQKYSPTPTRRLINHLNQAPFNRPLNSTAQNSAFSVPESKPNLPNLPNLPQEIRSRLKCKTLYPLNFHRINRPEVIKVTTGVVHHYAKKAPYLGFIKNRFYLKHNSIKTKFSQMIEHDWTELQILELINCQIKDEQLQIFTNNAMLFTCLEYINLADNFITQVSRDFLNLSQLKYVNFGTNYFNQLTSQSIDVLLELKQQNPNVTIVYQDMFDVS